MTSNEQSPLFLDSLVDLPTGRVHPHIDEMVFESASAVVIGLGWLSGAPAFGMSSGSPFVAQPGRYFGKISLDVTGIPGVSNMTVLYLKPGDGTGDQKNRIIDGLEPKYTPRDKTGYAELAVPLGIVLVKDDHVSLIPSVCSLTETMITESPSFVKRDVQLPSDYVFSKKTIGIDRSAFNDLRYAVFNNRKVSVHRRQFDATHIQNEFGQKHAISFDARSIYNTNDSHEIRKSFGEEVLQVCGFISLETENDYTRRIISSISR